MKISEGFSMADSRNLPKLDFLMLMQYMRENDCFNVAEIRGAKLLMSSRDEYVESAVGYVEVKRANPLCFVKARVTPEHRIRTKMYVVEATINEVDETITELKCLDCVASEGGCKHTICFIVWLIKRTEEPPVTSVLCYWSQPKLLAAVTKDKFIFAKEIMKRKVTVRSTHEVPNSLEMFLAECKKRKIEQSVIVQYNTTKESLDKYCIFDLLLEYSVTTENMSFDAIKEYLNNILTPEIKCAIEVATRGQAECNLWHLLRQGRVTASKIYEAIRCKTDGALVQTILGGYKVPETKAVKRGKHLEGQVIKTIEEEKGIKIESCGLMLVSPFVGASPDGICNDFCIEIKCPLTEKTTENYIKDNKISEKCKAQCQVQMHAMKKKKLLFCVADPNYERNKKYKEIWLYYDRLYVEKILREAEDFWTNYIMDKILNCTKS